MVKEEGDEDGREKKEAEGLGSDDEDSSDQDEREKELHAAGLVLRVVQDEIQLSREVGLGPRVRAGRQGGGVEVGREFQGRTVQTERTGTWERGDTHAERRDGRETHAQKVEEKAR